MRVYLKADLEMEEVLPAAPRSPAGDIELELPDSACIPDAVAATTLKPDEAYMVSVNSQVVVKSARSSHRLNDGDIVTILAPLRGG